MPMLKIGVSTYNDKQEAVYLMQGNATRDAESKPVNGKDHYVVGIAAAEDANGDTIYVNLNGWRSQADVVSNVRKGDSVLAVGKLKKREYQGRNYYDLDADFVCKNGAGLFENGVSIGCASPMGELPDFTPATGGVGVDASGFAEIEEDGELPF